MFVFLFHFFHVTRCHNIHAGAAHVRQYHIPGMHGGLQSRGIQRSHHGKHRFLWHRLRGFDRAARVQPTRNAHGAGNDAGGVGQFLFAVCSAVGAGIAGHGIVICGVHPQMAPLGAADADQLFYCFCHDCGTSSTAMISGPSAFCSRALGSVMCSISPGARRSRLKAAILFGPQRTVMVLGP